jgi:hypothetical protein
MSKHHQAQCGRRRVFLSRRDMVAYEDGYDLWPQAMPPEVAVSGPFSSGWHDRDHQQEQHNDARADAAREGAST